MAEVKIYGEESGQRLANLWKKSIANRKYCDEKCPIYWNCPVAHLSVNFPVKKKYKVKDRKTGEVKEKEYVRYKCALKEMPLRFKRRIMGLILGGKMEIVEQAKALLLEVEFALIKSGKHNDPDYLMKLYDKLMNLAKFLHGEKKEIKVLADFSEDVPKVLMALKKMEEEEGDGDAQGKE